MLLFVKDSLTNTCYITEHAKQRYLNKFDKSRLNKSTWNYWNQGNHKKDHNLDVSLNYLLAFYRLSFVT